jgi:hypothetical protein
MMSSFDKFFNNIQDKASRYYRRLADLDDLIYDKYFNKFRGKTVFEAEVLTDPGETAAEGSTGNTDLFVPLRVRIKDIHDNRLPDPYQAVEGIKDEVKKLDEFRKLILSHPVAYPDTKNLMESSISDGITQGSIVEVYFAEDGPNFNGRMRGLRYRQVIIAAPARTIPSGLSVSSGFEGGQTLALGDGAGIENPEKLDGDYPNSESLRTRVNQLIPFLQQVGYNEEIYITSAYRSPQTQVDVMIQNLFQDGDWDPSAKTWITTTYGLEGLINLVSLRFDEKQPLNDFKPELSSYVTANIRYISSHPTGNAIDIRTAGKSYANVELLKKGLQKAKDDGLVKRFKWEYIDGTKPRFVANREKRKSGEVTAINNEHLHVTFNRLKGQ